MEFVGRKDFGFDEKLDALLLPDEEDLTDESELFNADLFGPRSFRCSSLNSITMFASEIDLIEISAVQEEILAQEIDSVFQAII